MTIMKSRYLGLDLATPLVASPSPLTGKLDVLLELEDAGVGAVVLPSLFEEEVESEALVLNERLETGAGAFSEATDFFPDVELDHLGLERHILLVEEACTRLTIPVIASVNGRSAGGWVRYAQDLVSAGAQAIELNMYDVAADPMSTGAAVERAYLELVAHVRASVDVPVSVKLSPFFSSMANFAGQVVDSGADGLVLFNRFYQPDLDLETLDVTPRLELSRPGEIRLPLRWIAILRPLLPHTSLALTSGVASGADIAKGLLAGADVVMSTSELLRHGPRRAEELLDELETWMAANDYESVGQLRGSVAQHTSPDPGAFERAQYQKVLSSWRG
ncbi:MAG: dihydroorotate dehydrogenase-like protein [Actinomycetales bacterium]|nr:dihydroorotate dehydrogenase-like protein [Actinomycetales bacterium]